MRIAIVDDCENDGMNFAKDFLKAHFQGHMILKFANITAERIF